MKFFFNKIICLLLLCVSLAWADQTSAQHEVVSTEENSSQPEAVSIGKNELLAQSGAITSLDQAEKAIYKIRVIEKIINNNQVFLGKGTGFFIAEDLFVTAFHVVKSAQDIRLMSLYPKGGDESSSIKIRNLEYVSLNLDLAILRTETKSPYFLKQGETPLNENLTVIGYPKGQFRRWESEGFATPFPQPYDSIYTIEVEKEEDLSSGVTGVSGGPLLNSKGEYVGVISMNQQGTNVLSFIPSESIDKFLNEEIGRRCSEILCIKEEFEMIRNHIETYAHNTEEIPLNPSFVPFHYLLTVNIFEVIDSTTVLLYLSKAVVQDENFYETFIKHLLFLKFPINKIMSQRDEIEAITGRSRGIIEYRGVKIDWDWNNKDRDWDWDTYYLDWLHEAGEQGSVVAQQHLYSLYIQGFDGEINVEKDDKQAFYWAKKAAEQGQVGAQYITGSYYLLGTGVEQDLDQALNWFQEVADQDYNQEAKEAGSKALKMVQDRLKNKKSRFFYY